MQYQFSENIVTLTKAYAFILCLFVLVPLFTPQVAADSNGEFNERIDPGTYKVVPFGLNDGEAIYTRFHVTYGPGIYFFIVDQDGYEDIMAGREASTRYEENTYEAEDGQWYYVGFEAPHDSTWYVWWSKAFGTPYSGSAARIEGHVRKDTDPPQIVDLNVPSELISGIVDIEYKAHDLGYPISRIDLLVNDSIAKTYSDPENNHYTTGFEVRGVFHWDSNTVDNGNYTLGIRVWDSLGHQAQSPVHTITVENTLWNNLGLWIVVIGLGVIIFLLFLLFIASRR